MKKVLVPCDFSQPAINAYRFALDIARQSGGDVYLLHVIELPAMYDTALMPVLNLEQQLLAELHENSEMQLKGITERYKAEDVRVFSTVQFGLVSPTIQHYIAKEGIDLVVMGSHGASGFREVFIGSNAERVVRNSPVPVLVMKDYYEGPIKDIVFPNTLDTGHQEDLVIKIKALQEFFKARLHIVWINTPSSFMSDVVTNERLKAFVKHFKVKDYTLNVFNSVDEETGILEFANLINANLITIGTHGRRGISHLLNGSIAEDVVNHGNGIVWTYSMKNEPVEANFTW